METIIKKAIKGGWKPTDDWDEVEFIGIRSFSGLSFALSFKGIYSEEDANEDLKITAGTTWESTIHIAYRTAVCDPLFWQSLGKACGWVWGDEADTHFGKAIDHINIYHALRFHEINLTEGWSKAVEYLEGIIK